MNDLIDNFDIAVSTMVHSLPVWMNEPMHFFTFIGEPFVTIPILIAVAFYGLWRHSRRISNEYVVASAIGLITFGINSVIKILVHRNRPEAYLLANHVLPTYSFPSGHAAGSMIAFGLIAYIVWSKVANNNYRWLVLFIAALLIFAIGISRIYLGYHYPTDVLGGWIVGLIGLAIINWKVKFV